MAVEKRGQAVAPVLLGVASIADADHGRLKQIDDRREDFLAAHAWRGHIFPDVLAKARKGIGKHNHMLILHVLAYLAKLGVIAVLLSPSRIVTGGLDMAVRVGANPHSLPGRRDRERADARQDGLVGDDLSARGTIAEALARPASCQAWIIRGRVGEPGELGGVFAVDDYLRFRLM